MLHELIFFFVAGAILGVAIGSLALYSSWLTQTALRFLRVGLWLPFLVIFAVPETFWLGITAVTLCTCYHYLAARSLLGLRGNELRTYVAREAALQALFISLISQIWVQRWIWFGFWAPVMNPSMGFEVLAVLVAFIAFVNWIFRSGFDVTAEARADMRIKELNKADWRSFLSVVLLTVACLATWQVISGSRFNFLRSSPLDAVKAAYHLFGAGEIWGDIRLSVLEVVSGMVSGGSLALIVFALLSPITLRNLLFLLLPLTYISSLVLWLLVFVFLFFFHLVEPGWQGFIYFWNKVIAVGCLTFFLWVQALWGLRNHSWPFCILLAVDDALPIAFVAMLFLGSLWLQLQDLDL